MGLLVNLRWCVAQLHNPGYFEITPTLLGGDPTGFRRELRLAAKAAGMRVHTRLTDLGMFAWDPDHTVSDDLDDVAHPRCPECGVLMRDVPEGWECPACGHSHYSVPGRTPRPEFDGPSIRGG